MDLSLDYGDFSIQKIEEDMEGTCYYDLVLDSTEETVARIVRRTLETPLSYIKTAIQGKLLEYLDKDYGNPLYKKLGEPFTMSFLIEAKSDIERTLLKIEDIPGLVINSVNISDFYLNSLDININYTYNSQTTTSQISLSL